MSAALVAWLATESVPLPRYGHTAAMVGSAILLVTVVVIAGVTLLIIWGRRGR
jgi:hypothetical protein